VQDLQFGVQGLEFEDQGSGFVPVHRGKVVDVVT